MPMKIDVLVLQRDPRNIAGSDGLGKRRPGDEPYVAICLTKLPGGVDPTAGWSRDEAINKMRDQVREILRHFQSYSVETVNV